MLKTGQWEEKCNATSVLLELLWGEEGGELAGLEQRRREAGAPECARALLADGAAVLAAGLRGPWAPHSAPAPGSQAPRHKQSRKEACG